jgi:Mn-dependent DtxR family transcriptional regulator
MSILRNNGYVIMDDSGYLHLTDSGMEVATKIYDRHNTLSAFLTWIGVDEETATDDACRIEHVISDETMAAIKACMEKNK